MCSHFRAEHSGFQLSGDEWQPKPMGGALCRRELQLITHPMLSADEIDGCYMQPAWLRRAVSLFLKHSGYARSIKQHCMSMSTTIKHTIASGLRRTSLVKIASRHDARRAFSTPPESALQTKIPAGYAGIVLNSRVRCYLSTDLLSQSDT